jgi:hypothetical protein
VISMCNNACKKHPSKQQKTNRTEQGQGFGKNVMREKGSIKRMGIGLYRQKMVGMKSRSKGRQGEGCIGTTGT